MKIVDRKTFLSMPSGTVFAHFEPSVFGDLMIKGATMGRDFVQQDIAGAIAHESSVEFFDLLEEAMDGGTSMPMDFDNAGRNGMFEATALFAVFEPADVRALITRLQQALVEVGDG